MAPFVQQQRWRRPTLLMIGMLLVACVSATARGDTASGQTLDLDALQWERRVWVVIAPDASDVRVAQQRELLDAHETGLVDRDVTVFMVFSDQVIERGGARYGAADAAALRARYDVDMEAFAVILIGKDGGEKARYHVPVAPAKVFALIDAMPMRQREMRERGR